jgi:hypothetical protein
MKIQEQDIYHGAALMQIVEHDSFKALNKADARYGHYLVNKDIRLWIKYASSENGPWQFTLNNTDLEAIDGDRTMDRTVYLVLICGKHSICCLDASELANLVDFSAKQQWIKVDSPPKKQLHVTGSEFRRSQINVPHKRFPHHIFGDG